jgi:GNAT superfamily N-acetyltransferase
LPLVRGGPHGEGVEISYAWRGYLTDAEMLDLVRSHGGDPVAGWWPRVREHSLGWVTARDAGRGIGTALVGHAVDRARQAGCEWLHVDFDDHLAAFYFDACGFRPTAAGLINLQRAE